MARPSIGTYSCHIMYIWSINKMHFSIFRRYVVINLHLVKIHQRQTGLNFTEQLPQLYLVTLSIKIGFMPSNCQAFVILRLHRFRQIRKYVINLTHFLIWRISKLAFDDVCKNLSSLVLTTGILASRPRLLSWWMGFQTS